jgi:uroporphyrinogen decarboxylase
MEPASGNVRPKKLLLRALAGERTERPPIWLMRQAGLHAETDRILRALSGGSFVFNLGHGIVKTTPPEHVTALAEQVRSWTTPAPPDRLE